MDSQGNVLETVGNAGDGSINFTELEFSEAGTFVYQVREVKGNQKGISYDDKVIDLEIQVVDDGMGQLSGSIKTQSDQSFINTYKAKPASVQVSLNKKLIAGLLKANQFEFELLDSQGNVLETVGNAGDGSINFTELEFSEAGTFVYQVREVKENQKGISYDDKVIDLDIQVVDDGMGQLSGSIKTQSDQSFINTYKAKPASVQVSLNKKLLGGLLKANQFEFELLDSQGNLLESVRNAEDGSINFTELEFSEAGTFKYQVREVKGNQKGISYDDKVIDLEIKTEIIEDKVEARVLFKNGDTFVNQIKTEPKLPPTGQSTRLTPYLFTLLGMILLGFNKKENK